MLVAPLRNHYQEVIGVVQLLNKLDGEFTSRDERLLTAMASQAAISIENTRLYAQEIQQQLINQDLATAKSIQMSFLPQRAPQHESWDIASFWLPMRDVGGDFFDFYQLPDGRWAFVIADVSGKGVPAAMFMAFSVTVLRFAMGLSFTPIEVMDRANQVMISDQKSKMFATVFVTYLDLDTGKIECASAGHNPPLLYRAREGRCEYLEISGVAMGLFTNATFEQESSILEPGDILVMYTDGITEIVDAADEEFGEEQLEGLIVENAALSAQGLTDLIVESITEFAIHQGTFDDETLIVIKRVG
jgi:sigma-B regulation protein RsbU (phosphoserine phosphatase)